MTFIFRSFDKCAFGVNQEKQIPNEENYNRKCAGVRERTGMAIVPDD
jgi:hypothetical protein